MKLKSPTNFSLSSFGSHDAKLKLVGPLIRTNHNQSLVWARLHQHRQR